MQSLSGCFLIPAVAGIARRVGLMTIYEVYMSARPAGYRQALQQIIPTQKSCLIANLAETSSFDGTT